MEPTANHVHFLICFAVSFIAFGLIGKWYLWPGLKEMPMEKALSPLLLYACLRVNGLTFLIPGVVSPELPALFAKPTAYGDLGAVILALVALWAVRHRSGVAIPLVWGFNILGLLDLIYANVVFTFIANVDPSHLGASFFLVVLNVPAMIVVHIIIFGLLLQPRSPKLVPSVR